MNIQLQQAFEGAYKLPLFEQNILAEALIATIRNYELFADDEKQWKKIGDRPRFIFLVPKICLGTRKLSLPTILLGL